MHENSDRSFLEVLAAALEPYLSADAKKAARSLQGILGLFPGQSLAEIENNIKSLLASTQNSVQALADRARAFVGETSSETAESLVKAAGKLSVPDLKQLGNKLDLELTGAKGKMVADFRIWLESGGKTHPQTAKDKVTQKAKEYAEGLAERMQQLDDRAADDIIARAEAASKDKTLGAEGFKEFACLLGVSVSGTKPKMLTQFKNAINQRAVSRAQTQF